MLEIELSVMIRRLNPLCRSALEAAAGLCMSRGHYEVNLEHLMSHLVQETNADVQLALNYFGIDPGRVDKQLNRHLESERSGNKGRPVFSRHLLSWFQDSLLLATADYNWRTIRSGALFTTLVLSPHTYTAGAWTDLLTSISKEKLRLQLPNVVDGSKETEQAALSATDSAEAPGTSGPHSRGPETALGRFTIDFTAQARSGDSDPVVGREMEIRQCIDILCRRRKNNPIIVGEAGVGKTALVEGLAQKVIAGALPTKLQGVEILGLDMGLLQAGAGVKGEFENRLKSVIEEVKGSPTPIIIFIDEAHTMIGAGGAAGGGDAANLLKPALARGELRTVAATTWSEYKKYFEKDPALSRRFQLIKVDEPSVEVGIEMMRGIAPNFEKSHNVQIRNDAVEASVELSARYITGRQLPDKSVDLIDTCSARVAVAQGAKPPVLQDLEYEIMLLERHRKKLVGEEAEGVEVEEGVLESVVSKLATVQVEADAVESRWRVELEAAEKVMALREKIRAVLAAAEPQEAPEAGEGAEEAPAEEAPAEEKPAEEKPAEDAEEKPAEDAEDAEEITESVEELKVQLNKALEELAELQKDEVLVPVDVTYDLVAAVVADWTGIPIGKMVENEAATLQAFEELIGARIKGQGYALQQLGEVIRGSKMGLGNPDAPIGVFLMVGPSGVGKTETGLAIAEMLFGGERFMVAVNMSEFQEKHTVSRLIGSPPGYVGYGEGGVLTEAVRQRPYSAVMLDETEKADPEVMNLFYQVFDKGQLSDGEGREINFKNTIMLMTSNLGSDVMTAMCADPENIPDVETIVEAIRPILSNHFKPALLARMTIVPFLPLAPDAMREIVQLKLGKLVDRMMDSHKISLTIGDTVIDQITQRCTEVETGARNIDHIMNKSLLPLLSSKLLSLLAEGELPDAMTLDVDDKGEYTLSV